MLRNIQPLLLRHFRRNADGLAAVEFALILPAMIAMLFGMAELSSAVNCRIGISQLASTVADLTAQKSAPTTSDISSIYAAANTILYPHNTANPTIRITSVIFDTATNSATVGKVAWSCTQSGSGTLDPATRAENSKVTLQTSSKDKQLELLTSGSSVLMTEVAYDYTTPTMRVVAGTIAMKDSFYTKPRRVAQIPKPASCP
jgi:Flp pilus assembly protein TadG